MHEYSNFIKPDEHVDASTSYQPPPNQARRFKYQFVTLAAFFCLPIFLTLQIKGLLIWLVAVFLLWRRWSRRFRAYLAILTDRALYSLSVKQKRVHWRVPIETIETIRVHGKGILIRQRKKVYLLPMSAEDESFFAKLRSVVDKNDAYL